MTKDKTTYETGATSHAVNDLILFTDNTRELAEYRDKCFAQMANGISITTIMHTLLTTAQERYKKEFPQFMAHQHIAYETEKWGVHNGKFNNEMRQEYIKLYLKDFETWKLEHGYK